MTGSIPGKEQIKRFRCLCGILLLPWLLALVVKLQRTKILQSPSNLADFVADESCLPNTSTPDEQHTKQERPLLVLHVGPGKTGTTGLQVGLTKPELQASLREDGYWYAGRYYNHTHMRPNGQLNEGQESFSPLLKVLREILIPRKAVNMSPLQYCSDNKTQDCWHIFRRELDQAAQAHDAPSVLISDEPLALRWSAERFATLNRSLVAGQRPQESWKPLIVVSYRRFYEWLPSSIYQRNRKRLRDIEWPGSGDLQALELLWPNTVTQWRERHYTFMDSLVDQAQQAGLGYKILNIHLANSWSIRTQFLCHVLPHASVSCAASRQMDEQQLVVRSSSLASTSSQSGSRNKKKRVNARDQETIELMYQDMIATQAASQGLVQQSVYSRTHVRDALREYLLVTNQTAVADLPQYCPTHDELDVLLQQSLDMEAAYILPTLPNDPLRQQWVDEHRQGFDEMVASNTFCILDAKAAVRQLLRFFEQFAK